jgi:hypothetical protein
LFELPSGADGGSVLLSIAYVDETASQHKLITRTKSHRGARIGSLADDSAKSTSLIFPERAVSGPLEEPLPGSRIPSAVPTVSK